MTYFGEFTSRENVAAEFHEGTGGEWNRAANAYDPFIPAPDFPTHQEIQFASYDIPSYEGYAFVLFIRNGQLFEVNGSHCSCYGLEGQWEPEETSWKALAMRKYEPSGIVGVEAAKTFKKLVELGVELG